MQKYKLAIFDLDGTLLNTIGGIAKSMNNVLQSHNLATHDIEKYTSFVGNGLKILAKRALGFDVSDDELDGYYKELLVQYEKHYMLDIAPYDGIINMLRKITKKGYKIAINSNKVDYMLDKIVDEIFGEFSWVKVVGVCDNLPSKPDKAGVELIIKTAGVRHDEAVFIGDTDVDIQTAHNANVDAIYVPWGFRKPHEINESNYKSVKDANELTNLLLSNFKS
ncbi:N-acetylmuramic acid 6-phosphate phosphatase [Campylobacter majalis]|uniref:phosphoglycolate phosphatase n=1 Tax=Campylobacter majalis TaxID=2790656 RepID=A0ABM8Q432_9BACT|nr:HAD family hydrolase [Campylobacter majalis]CAD7287645.1 N-acetylmuramic acid 6-phosphate phosphatase [Campylobacter majalis]